MRSCGACTECCTVAPVHELNKPAGTTCTNLILLGKKARKAGVSSGCGIHADRPAICRGFACGWLSSEELLTDAERPDKLGVIVVPLAVKEGVPIFWAWEARRGGLAGAHARLQTLGGRIVAIPLGATAGEWTKAEWTGIVRSLGAAQARVLAEARNLDVGLLEDLILELGVG